MSGYVVRRSALSLTVLGALLAAGGGLLVALGTPVWVPFVISLLFVLAQWSIGPYAIEWLIPATPVAWRNGGYCTGHPLGEMVARRCAEAGLRPVRLGIVDDGTPNAFTFGHTRGNARIYVTRGLLERLDERELDAVISHEVAHVKQNDVVVMAFVSTVPLILYYAFLVLRANGNQNTVIPAVVAFLGYLLSELAVLAVSRARELGADHYSCRVTGDGDALCSALIAIGYGMGQIDAERASEARQAQEDGDEDAERELAREERRHQRIRAAGMLGIADMRHAPTILAARERGLEPSEVVGGLRWDTCNPWARFLQLFSTHPLIVRRIAALEASRLPGAPRRWSAVEVAATSDGPELSRARRRFWLELPVRLLPWAAVLVLAVGWGRDDFLLMARAATVGGLGLLVLTTLQRPPGPSPVVERVTSLLTRLDAGPVTGMAAELRGRVIGRGAPGYVLSPDLVVQDDSGFVPVLYRQPWPFARTFFGVLRADEFIDQDVVVRGWYRRNPAPIFELRELRAADGTRVRGSLWIGAYLVGVAATVIGGAVWMFLT